MCALACIQQEYAILFSAGLPFSVPRLSIDNSLTGAFQRTLDWNGVKTNNLKRLVAAAMKILTKENSSLLHISICEKT